MYKHLRKMVSLSREWIEISKARTGGEFIQELSDLLDKYNVKDVLECGCGGGHVLYGLAKRGFNCIGIDNTKEMIDYAKQNYSSENLTNLSYQQLNWRDLRKLNKKFHAIICRGNTLVWGTSWEKSEKEFDNIKTINFIYKSVGTMLYYLKKKGLLYIDTISQEEINNNGGEIGIKSKNLSLKGRINYDWNKRIRHMEGGGMVNNEEFCGSFASYLMIPKELETIIKHFKPNKIWNQKMKYEKDYDVICAIK